MGQGHNWRNQVKCLHTLEDTDLPIYILPMYKYRFAHVQFTMSYSFDHEQIRLCIFLTMYTYGFAHVQICLCTVYGYHVQHTYGFAYAEILYQAQWICIPVRLQVQPSTNTAHDFRKNQLLPSRNPRVK